jgi:SagB-type dehydrogenase family enzyme
LRAPGPKKGRRKAPPLISARVNDRITVEADADGNIAAFFDGHSVGLGKFSAAAVKRAQMLHTGLPLASFVSDGRTPDGEIDLLVRRLAQRGLLEYRFGRAQDDKDTVVIEPQMSDYRPRTPEINDADALVLSRFAYMRRRGDDMVLESPRAGALFRIGDPDIAAFIAKLSSPRQLKQLRRQDGFPGIGLLALLVDCGIVFRIDAAGGDGLRGSEGDDNLVLWDFHDLLFHTHSTQGRQANPIGGLYPYAQVMPPPPAVRPPWPGTTIDLAEDPTAASQMPSPLGELIQLRHSTRDFDDKQPITLAELAAFLDGTARVKAKWTSTIDLGGGGPDVDFTARPYPSAGSAYELELYLAVANCEGLARGFYHYDADRHALVPIGARPQEVDALLASAVFAMDAPAVPQILITIAARFNRVSWKYGGIAYALILKDVGVLIQTLYLMATEMGLGGCAIGTHNIELFAKMTGIEFHIEGPVGQFALGRRGDPRASG